MHKEIFVWVLEHDEDDEDEGPSYIVAESVDDIPDIVNGKIVGVYKLDYEAVFQVHKGIGRQQ